MIEPQKTEPPTVEQADDQPIDDSVAQRARERRYQRAVAGWFASGIRAYAHNAHAHERRRPMDDLGAR
jgi:hypothetical protein